MWKVIAADDEPFIREALKEMIPWDELGCHLAEALKKWERSSKCCRKIQTGYRNTGYTNATYDRDGGCAVDT